MLNSKTIGFGAGWNQDDDGLLSNESIIYSKGSVLVRSTYAWKEKDRREYRNGAT